MIVLALFIIAQSTPTCYKAATEIVCQDAIVQDIDCFSENSFEVMKEPLNFEWFRGYDIKNAIELDEGGYSYDGPITGLDVGKRRSRFKIFYSNIRAGYFYAGVLCARKYSRNFDDCVFQNELTIFLFKTDDNREAQLIGRATWWIE